jgi:hypothetical protein
MEACPNSQKLLEAALGISKPSVLLRSDRLYHKLRRHKSWHNLEGLVTAALGLLLGVPGGF